MSPKVPLFFQQRKIILACFTYGVGRNRFTGSSPLQNVHKWQTKHENWDLSNLVTYVQVCVPIHKNVICTRCLKHWMSTHPNFSMGRWVRFVWRYAKLHTTFDKKRSADQKRRMRRRKLSNLFWGEKLKNATRRIILIGWTREGFHPRVTNTFGVSGEGPDWGLDYKGLENT